jgi:hypothetical protein
VGPRTFEDREASGLARPLLFFVLDELNDYRIDLAARRTTSPSRRQVAGLHRALRHFGAEFDNPRPT